MTELPITYNVNCRIKANQLPATKKLAGKLFEVAAKEKGILAYELMFEEGGNRMMIYEQYKNEAAFNAHLANPALGPLLEQLMGLVDFDSFDMLSPAPKGVIAALKGIAPVKQFNTAFGLMLQKKTV